MRFIGALAGGLAVFMAVGYWTGHLDAMRLGRRPARPRLSRRAWLAQAGTSVSPLQFVVVSAGLGVVTLLLAWAVTGSPTVGAVPAVAGGFLPRTWYAYHRKARMHAVVAAWPDGILHVLSAIRAGHSVHGAIVDLASSGPEPLQEAFRFYEAWSRVGNPVAALHTVQEQLADPISDKAIAVLIEANKHGTEVATAILSDLAEEIRMDERTTAQIRAAQREPRITGWAAFALPWIGLVFGCATAVEFREFYASAGGRTVLLIGAVISLTQLAITRWLAKEAPEARVLGGTP